MCRDALPASAHLRKTNRPRCKASNEVVEDISTVACAPSADVTPIASTDARDQAAETVVQVGTA
jgi:hypothetical protein